MSAHTHTHTHTHTHRADEETRNWMKFRHSHFIFVFHVSSGNGGWSAKGCEVVFRNSTHISCQCYHMTSFAVLMDVSRREVSDAETFNFKISQISLLCPLTRTFLSSS